MDLDLSALPLAVQAQFNEHLTGLAMMCREHQLDATQVGQAVTMAAAKRLSSRLCEDCDSKTPSYGLEDERKRRWCYGCAKAHVGAVHLHPERKCEDCGLKGRSFGMESDRNRMRWCSGCAKVHAGAVRLHKDRKCEDCALKVPSFAMEVRDPTTWTILQ